MLTGGLKVWSLAIQGGFQKNYHKFASENWVYMLFYGFTNNFHGKKGACSYFEVCRGGGSKIFLQKEYFCIRTPFIQIISYIQKIPCHFRCTFFLIPTHIILGSWSICTIYETKFPSLQNIQLGTSALLKKKKKKKIRQHLVHSIMHWSCVLWFTISCTEHVYCGKW